MVYDIPVSTAVKVIERNVTSVGRCWHIGHHAVACNVVEEYEGTAEDTGATCTFSFKYVAKATRRPDGKVVVTELTHPPDATCSFS